MSIPLNFEGQPVATEDEIERLTKVQYILSCSEKMNADEICGAISSLLDISNPECASFIARELIYAFLDPLQDSKVILEVITTFCFNSREIKMEMIEILGKPLSESSIKIYHFRILKHLYSKGVLMIEEIIRIIALYPVSLQNQYLALIAFFAADLEKFNADNFREIYMILMGFKDISPTYKVILSDIEEAMNCSKYQAFKKWHKIEYLCEKGYAEIGQNRVFFENKIDKIMAQIKADPLARIERSPFYPNEHYFNRPTIILLAAYRGMMMIFTPYVYKSLSQKDDAGKGVNYYAACGGDVHVLEAIKAMDAFKFKPGTERKSQGIKDFSHHTEIHVPPITRDLGAIGMHAAVKSMLKCESKKRLNCGILAAAASERRFDAMKWMLDNIEIIQEDLDLALVAAAKSNFLAGIRFLIDNGANVNCKSEGDMSPLHVACENGSIEAVKLLLTINGVNINIKNDKDQTIVHSAAYGKNRNVFDLVCSLQGIQKDAVDIYRNTPEAVFNE